MPKKHLLRPGSPNPHGAKADEYGVNFSIFSRHATHVELLLFEKSDSPEPFQAIQLEPQINRLFYSWHIYVEGLAAGAWYTWRMDGPDNTSESGLIFDPDKHLLDPWARVVSDKLWQRESACIPGDNGKTALRSMVVDESYDWESDQPLNAKSDNAVIYELHVGGYTNHNSAKVQHPGTFSGLIEKIPYLQELGITHVELLPVMAFDEQHVPRNTASLGLKNYWGYSTHSFFSPHPGFCVTPEQGTHLTEFKDLVKALHRAGIGVILDVVFNHTSEAGVGGPIINFRGIDNSVYYHLDPVDKSIYHDYTGCGNTVNANHPIVANFIIDCLEYWVAEMHVDGFRFDLASALARGEGGHVLHDPPLLWGIELSGQLANTKLIAEAWDAAGLYQVGSFPGYRWAEWNGRYRDIVRRFIRGDNGLLNELATRLTGSSDLYKGQGRLPINSINFVTCHDGFTLNDLLSYEQKHNEANGEDSRDGCDNNLSRNYGVEGKTEDAQILSLRQQQAKNVIAILMISQGIPMILAGDEVLNSQQGNNNTYCQDNELSWFDWSLIKKNREMFRFVQLMIALRKSHPSLMRRQFLTGENINNRDIKDITWYGKDLNSQPWDDQESSILAYTLASVDPSENDLHIILNMTSDTVHTELPKIARQKWYRAVDTSRKAPEDICEPKQQKVVRKNTYSVPSRTIIILEGRKSKLGAFFKT